MNTAKLEPSVIDLRGVYYSTELHARMIWQELYNLYVEHGCDTKRLDNLLCDHTAMIRMMEAVEMDGKVWYWSAHRYGQTSLRELDLLRGYDEETIICLMSIFDIGAKIEFLPKKIIVTPFLDPFLKEY